MKCGYVAIIGITNSGKSTLMNRILNAKVSIVTHKIQTTNKFIYGVKNIGNSQIILVDTPGIYNPKNIKYKIKQPNVFSLCENNDVVAIIINGEKPNFSLLKKIFDKSKNTKAKKIIIINKIDKITKVILLNTIDKINKIFNNNYDIVPISAKKNVNIDKLEKIISNFMPKKKHIYKKNELIVDFISNDYIKQLIREKTLYYLHSEIPYNLRYFVDENYYDNEKNIRFIYASIICSKNSIKEIIIGKNANKIKAISFSVRKELELINKVRIFIKINVKKEK